MGKLIDPDRTRRARDERRRRAERILEAAQGAFLRFPYSEISLDTIGQLAGAKQGQATLAFRSREELYLTVIRSQLKDWYDALEATLEALDAPVSAASAADVVAASLVERPDLTRLLGPLHMALELHEDGMEVHRFYQWQKERLLGLAAILSDQLESGHQWDCFDALYRSQLIAAAVHPVSRPVGNLAIDLVNEEHQIFALDLEDELRRVVLDTLSG